MERGSAIVMRAFPSARSMWQQKVRNVGTIECFLIGSAVVLVQDHDRDHGWNVFTTATDDGRIAETLEAIGRKAEVEPAAEVVAAFRKLLDPKVACKHEWQEQPGEPPVDVCSQCGERRE